MIAIKSDSDSDSDEQKKTKKRSPGFEKKREEETRDDTAELATKKVARFFRKNRGNRGVTASVAAPGVTHPSDATAESVYLLLINSWSKLLGALASTRQDVFVRRWNCGTTDCERYL